MAARNYLTMMNNVKAVCFDKQVFQQFSEAYPNPFSMTKLLQERGLVTKVLTDAELDTKKSNANDFLAVASHLRVSPKETVYIGNDRQAIAGANTAGMISVFADHEQNYLNFGQHFSVSSLDELLDYL